MTLATVRVVVSKELSISHDCCPRQHGYIRSTHSRQSAEFAGLGALHTLTQLSAHGYAATGPPAHKWEAVRIFIPSLAVS